MPCTVCYDLATRFIKGVVSSIIPDTQEPPAGVGLLRLTDADLQSLGITNPLVEIPNGKMVDLDMKTLTDYTPPVDYPSHALDALAQSDRTILRCCETGIAVPAEWHAYRQGLRAIADGKQGPLPARPDYPAGT